MDASTSNDKDPHCLPGGSGRGPVSAAKQPARIPGRDPPLLSRPVPRRCNGRFCLWETREESRVARGVDDATRFLSTASCLGRISSGLVASRHAEVQRRRRRQQRRQRAGRAAGPVKVQPTFTLQPDARNNRNLLSASRDNSYLQSGSAEQWAITRPVERLPRLASEGFPSRS